MKRHYFLPTRLRMLICRAAILSGPARTLPTAMLLFLSLLLSAALPAAHSYAQVSISPTILFIHEEEPLKRLNIRNTGNTAQEISITPRFGYPESDEEGQLIMNYENEDKEAANGLNEYLRLFPRQFVLQPGEYQRIIVQVYQPEGLRDGLYWTRLNITSSEIVEDIEQATTNEGIGTRISYRIRQNIGLFFHKGSVESVLTLEQLQTQRRGDKLHMDMQLSAGGNSPFMGKLTARLIDDTGSEARRGEWLFSVFYNRYWPQYMDVEGLPEGRYRLLLEFEPSRSDVSPTDLPPANTLTETRFVEL